MNRTFLGLALYSLSIPLGVSSSAQTVTRGPYLQLSTETSVVVRWRTSSDSSSGVIYGDSPTNLALSVTDSTQTRDHEIEITGLEPGTKYYYAIGTSSTVLVGGDADHHFHTHLPTGSVDPFRVWLIGDAGTGNSNQRRVRDAYYDYNGSPEADLWIQLGDNAYSDGTDNDYQLRVFEVYDEILRNTPTYSTFGNHDAVSADSPSESGPYYDIFTLPTNGEAGGVASGTEAYYSFDYGNVHFICLDSSDTDLRLDRPMAQWLMDDLAATDQDWIIAFWHHPPYSKGSHDSDTEFRLYTIRQRFLPLLEAGGVDVVFSGHSHNYERSALLDGHYGFSWELSSSMVVDSGDGQPGSDGAYQKPPGLSANQGAVYVVNGASGQSSETDNPQPLLNHPVMASNSFIHGSVVLDMDGDTLTAVYLSRDGDVVDGFVIEKPGTVGSVVLVNPIGDVSIPVGVPYTGPLPILAQGTPPATWALEAGPSGMTIDSGTGVVSWPLPTVVGSPHTVTIRATTAEGFDDETWLLDVNGSVAIASIPNDTITDNGPYTGPTPSLAQGTPPAAWSLVTGPSGMTIDTETGVVSWPSPTVTGSPHTVRIGATTLEGFDTESWTLEVVDAVAIAPIPDDSITAGATYTGPTPSIVLGTPPFVWTLVEGPPGMTIDPATGVVTWPNADTTGSPHKLTIQVTAADGVDQVSWTLTVSTAATTVVDLSQWEFSPQLVVPFGSGPSAFPGDTILSSKVVDPDGDGSVSDLSISTANMETSQAFVHWDSPPDLIPYTEDATYRVTWVVEAFGFDAPGNVPQMRLRANYGFTGGLGSAAMIVPENGNVAPLIDGETTYELWFDELEVASANNQRDVQLGTPFDGLISTENAKRLHFDWVDFEGQDDPIGGGTLVLKSVVIDRFDRETLLAPSFVQRIIPGFTQGVSVDLFGGTLDTSPGSTMTVQFNSQNAVISSVGTNSQGGVMLFGVLPLALDVAGVAVLPFEPQFPDEARVNWSHIFLSSVAGNPAVPPLRVIMNAFNTFEGVNTISSETQLHALRIGYEGNGEVSSVFDRGFLSGYLALPSSHPTFTGEIGDMIQASLTMVDQDDPYVAAGSVTIDEIVIGSFPSDVSP